MIGVDAGFPKFQLAGGTCRVLGTGSQEPLNPQEPLNNMALITFLP